MCVFNTLQSTIFHNIPLHIVVMKQKKKIVLQSSPTYSVTSISLNINYLLLNP